MNKPTHGQWRGYGVLCVVLVVALGTVVFWPVRVSPPEPTDNSELAEAVALYAEEMLWNDGGDSSPYRRHHEGNRGHYQFDTRREARHYSSDIQPKARRNHYDTLLVEINTADTARLRQLRGIGPVFASRIVKYRTLLGGFVTCDQLLEVYGIDNDLFETIRPHICVSEKCVNKLKVNEAGFDELRKHPYIDYYQARAIVEYRKRVGAIKSVEDLYKINLLDEKTIIKISPYIQYNH